LTRALGISPNAEHARYRTGNLSASTRLDTLTEHALDALRICLKS
jgi:hypothetical protein